MQPTVNIKGNVQPSLYHVPVQVPLEAFVFAKSIKWGPMSHKYSVAWRLGASIFKVIDDGPSDIVQKRKFYRTLRLLHSKCYDFTVPVETWKFKSPNVAYT